MPIRCHNLVAALLFFGVPTAARHNGDNATPDNGAEGKSSPTTCLTCTRPSPINIVPREAYRDEDYSVRLSYSVWNLKDLRLEPRKDDRGGVSVFSFGGTPSNSIQVGSRYTDFDKYALQSIKVLVPSEHHFMGRRLPLEVQLWHQPTIKRDLALIRQKRMEVQAELSELYRQMVIWGSQVEGLQDVNRNFSFPSIDIMQDWVTATRRTIDSQGEELLRRVRHVEAEMKIIDDQTTMLIAMLQRKDAARFAVISMLFRASDASTPPQAEASEFVAWLAEASTMARDNGADGGRGDGHPDSRDKANYSRRLGSGGGGRERTGGRGDRRVPETFNFTRLPYHTTKDIGETSIRRVFAYEGSFTQPPCTPVVRWFVAQEPLVAYGAALFRFLNVSMAANLAAGRDVWWSGAMRDTRKVDPPLPVVRVESAVLSTSAFRAPEIRLNRDIVAGLPWSFVNFYCGTFLICSLFMLCTTLNLCAQKLCEE